MLKDAVLRARRKVITRLACDRDQTPFHGVLELAVAPSGAVEISAVFANEFKKVTDFQAGCDADARAQRRQSERRITPATTPTNRYAGRDFRLTDVYGHVMRDIVA